MKLALSIILALAAVGCHAQQPPSPPVYSCPVAIAGGSAYTPINSVAAPYTTAASISGSSYTYTPSSPGAYCYILQSWSLAVGATVYQDSVPSSAVQATTTAATPKIEFTWTPPAATAVYLTYTYILSQAPATLVAAPLAPAVTTPLVTATLDGPAAPVVVAGVAETPVLGRAGLLD